MHSLEREVPGWALANMNTLNISPTKCRWKSVTVHIACHSLTKPRDNSKHYVAGTNQSQFLQQHFFCIMRLGSETWNSISFSFQPFDTLQRVGPQYLSILWFSYKAKKRTFSNLCKPERGGLLVKFATLVSSQPQDTPDRHRVVQHQNRGRNPVTRATGGNNRENCICRSIIVTTKRCHWIQGNCQG